jgi:hypothetical protein
MIRHCSHGSFLKGETERQSSARSLDMGASSSSSTRVRRRCVALMMVSAFVFGAVCATSNAYGTMTTLSRVVVDDVSSSKNHHLNNHHAGFGLPQRPDAVDDAMTGIGDRGGGVVERAMTSDALSTLLKTKSGDGGGKMVFVSYVSEGFHEFASNWFESLRNAVEKTSASGTTTWAETNVVMLALDEATERYCAEKSLPCFGSVGLRYAGGVMATGGEALHGQSSQREATSTHEAAKALREIKTNEMKLLLDLLNRGYEVIVSDADVAWLDDPREWAQEALADVDVATSTDCLSAKHEDEDTCWHADFNTGILYFKPTEVAKEFLKSWINAMETATDGTEDRDQEIFINLLREGAPVVETKTEGSIMTATPRDALRVSTRTMARGVRLGLLPMRLFASGHTYFVERLHEKEKTRRDPFCVHATFQFSQVRGKRQRFREHGLWRIEEDEYYTNGNFIAMSDELPNAWNATGVRNHLIAAAWYRASVRNLLALGRVLGRTVILPRITCMCDRYWNAVLPSCKIGHVDPPFVGCPQDHIFNLPGMEKGKAEFREWTFLNNPRTPETIKKSVARVTIGDRTRDADYSLPAFPSDEEARSTLGSSKERVLVVDDALMSICALSASSSFDADMRVALKAESWFCGPERDDGSKCDIGFAIPTPLGELKQRCPSLRSNAASLRERPHALLRTLYADNVYGFTDKHARLTFPDAEPSAVRVDSNSKDDDEEDNPFATDDVR